MPLLAPVIKIRSGFVVVMQQGGGLCEKLGKGQLAVCPCAVHSEFVGMAAQATSTWGSRPMRTLPSTIYNRTRSTLQPDAVLLPDV